MNLKSKTFIILIFLLMLTCENLSVEGNLEIGKMPQIDLNNLEFIEEIECITEEIFNKTTKDKEVIILIPNGEKNYRLYRYNGNIFKITHELEGVIITYELLESIDLLNKDDISKKKLLFIPCNGSEKNAIFYKIDYLSIDFTQLSTKKLTDDILKS